MAQVIAWLYANVELVGVVILAVEAIIGASPLKSNSLIALVVNGLKKGVSFLKTKKIK